MTCFSSHTFLLIKKVKEFYRPCLYTEVRRFGIYMCACTYKIYFNLIFNYIIMPYCMVSLISICGLGSIILSYSGLICYVFTIKIKFCYKLDCNLKLRLYSISFHWVWILTNQLLDYILSYILHAYKIFAR